MPEGPECRLFAEWLRDVVNTREHKVSLGAAQILSGRYYHKTDLPIGRSNFGEIIHVASVGKLIWIEVAGGQAIQFTLGMTGGFSTVPTKHSRMRFDLLLGDSVDGFFYFNDVRNFGTVTLRRIPEINKKVLTLGVDVLSDRKDLIKAALCMAADKHGRKPIGELLLLQSVICGIGNYLRSEILHRAKVDPRKPVAELTDAECSAIADACSFAKKCYDAGGASLATYVNGRGERGNASSLFQVYKKKVDELGNPVTKGTVGGRSVYFVER